MITRFMILKPGISVPIGLKHDDKKWLLYVMYRRYMKKLVTEMIVVYFKHREFMIRERRVSKTKSKFVVKMCPRRFQEGIRRIMKDGESVVLPVKSLERIAR